MTLIIWLVMSILTLPIAHSTSAKIISNHKDCFRFLRELANVQKDYIQCVTDHAKPVELCVKCSKTYADLTGNYTRLKTNCSDIYFGQDRLNIVATAQLALTNLWERAHCEDCSIDDNEIHFDNASIVLNDCIEKHNQTACVTCLRFYKDLNDLYKSFEDRTNGKVCFDIQDKMNATRINWSTKLNCCHRSVNRTLFIVVATLVSAVPVIFYTGLYALTKYESRNHDVLREENTDVATPITSGIPRPTIVDPATYATRAPEIIAGM